MKRKLQLEVNFPGNFVPPEKFEDPEEDNNMNSACDLCPFFIYDEPHGFNCSLIDKDPHEQTCPIKDQF